MDDVMQCIVFCSLSFDDFKFEKAYQYATEILGEKFAESLKQFRKRNREKFLSKTK